MYLRNIFHFTSILVRQLGQLEFPNAPSPPPSPWPGYLAPASRGCFRNTQFTTPFPCHKYRKSSNPAVLPA